MGFMSFFGCFTFSGMRNTHTHTQRVQISSRGCVKKNKAPPSVTSAVIITALLRVGRKSCDGKDACKHLQDFFRLLILMLI